MTSTVIEFAPLIALVFWAAVVDLRQRRIPNWLTLLMIITGLARSVMFAHSIGPGAAFLGMFAAAAIPFALFAIGAMGGGDVKLMAGIGAWLGPWPALAVLACEKVIGLFIVLGQAICQKRVSALLGNSAVIAVNVLHIRDVGVDHLSHTGRNCRSIARPLPFAVPALIALVVVLSKIGSNG